MPEALWLELPEIADRHGVSVNDYVVGLVRLRISGKDPADIVKDVEERVSELVRAAARRVHEAREQLCQLQDLNGRKTERSPELVAA